MSKPPVIASSPSAESMAVSEYTLHTCFEGTAAQLIAAGVFPVGFKFPKRSKDLEFIAENGYHYTVEELWEPRGRYSVSVGLANMADITEEAGKMAATLLDACRKLPVKAQMGGLLSAILMGFNRLPGAPLRLGDVRGDCDDLESLSFDVLGPNVSRGTRCYSVAAVLEYYLIEDGLATGRLRKPSGYLLQPAAEKAAPSPAPARRHPIARTLETA